MDIQVFEMEHDKVATIKNHESFLFTYPKNYAEIFGSSIKEAHLNKKAEIFEGFLKITNKSGKSVYRRFRGYNMESNRACLGYRSMCELGVSNGDLVSVEPTTWFKYLIHNSDSYIKYTVIFAIVGVACSILSCILAIIQIIFCLV